MLGFNVIIIVSFQEVGVMLYKVENSGRIDQFPIFIAEAEVEFTMNLLTNLLRNKFVDK